MALLATLQCQSVGERFLHWLHWVLSNARTKRQHVLSHYVWRSSPTEGLPSGHRVTTLGRYHAASRLSPTLCFTVQVSVCLRRTSTPAPVTPATVPPAESSGLTYVGCFEDDGTGLTRFLADAFMQDEELTPTSCAAFCAG